jgi:multidrug efflux pump subunit AcrA (membrane-fusion protein)
MSDVERIFDRFIDAFADDLLEIARAYIDVEVTRALVAAERAERGRQPSKAQIRAEKRAQRLAAKAALKAQKQRDREQKRAARLAEKERLKAEQRAEKELRQAEHDRLKQERLALKQELEAERRRLREATRKRPARQLPLDFDGLRAPKPRRRDVPVPGAPPPLFVHKRRRDGQIEKLARTDEGGGPPEGASVSNGAAVTNGAAMTNGAASLTPAEAASTAE